jgi:outer membrane immunogenic protein
VKKLFLAVMAFGLVAAAGSASAADMPLKVPAAAPLPATNWTGCYIGGNGGAAWTNDSLSPVSVSVFGVDVPQGTAAASAVAGGGQVGCDYQLNSNWVIGMRGMWDATKAQGTSSGVFAGALSVGTNAEIKSFGTAVARVGYNLSPALMVYGVGGVAFAQNQYLQTVIIGGPPSASFPGSDAPTGWAAGGGMSWMLGPNWDIFVEYNYLGFGDRTFTTLNNGGLSLTTTVKQDVQTILAGLDFRFTNWAMGH